MLGLGCNVVRKVREEVDVGLLEREEVGNFFIVEGISERIKEVMIGEGILF